MAAVSHATAKKLGVRERRPARHHRGPEHDQASRRSSPRPGRRLGHRHRRSAAAASQAACARASASTLRRSARTAGCGFRRRHGQEGRRRARATGGHAGPLRDGGPAADPHADGRRAGEEPELARDLVKHPPLLNLWGDWQYDGAQVGHGDRPRRLHRLQRLRHRLPGREQHPGRRQGAGARGARDALDPHRPLLRRATTRRAARRAASSRCCASTARTRRARTVCPVDATAHSPEGLNDMAYNRCIGTRYCANNCPYKVRRFNFFDYTQRRCDDAGGPRRCSSTRTSPSASRGVMEKCTYCVQRIQDAKIDAKRERRRSRVQGRRRHDRLPAGLPDRGDRLRRPQRPDERASRKLQRERPRAYALLAELNTRPRTTLPRARSATRTRRSSRTSRKQAPTRTATSADRRRRDPGRSVVAASRSVRGDARPSTSITETVAERRRAKPPTPLVDRCSASRSPRASSLMLGGSLGYAGLRRASASGATTPVGWAWDITNFVFWIGIGHAGTLISRRSCSCSGRSGARRSTASPRR